MQSPPGRAVHSKSRNGCLRCKAKKTKCDERKPACARCESRGFQCPGYALNVRWSQKHQAAQAERPYARGPRTAKSPDAVSIRNMQTEPVISGYTTRAASDTGPSGLHSGSLINSPSHWDFILPDQLFDFQASPEETFMVGDEPSAAISHNAYLDCTSADSVWGANSDNSAASSTVDAMLSLGQRRLPDHNLTLSRLIDRSNPLQFSSGMHLDVGRIASSPPRELTHMPTVLSEHFFREVITLYCTWDSKSNTMRNIVERKWQSSGVLHHTIQSMAAACLSEDFPHFAPIAAKEHAHALEYIGDISPPSATPSEEKLLASTMLGHTASWLNPQSLATDMFRVSCDMVRELPTDGENTDCKSFFSDTMDYWAMLLVYLTDRQNLGTYTTESEGPATGASDPSQPIEPHPYSGLSRETVKLLTDVGILIFQYRKHISNVKFMTERDLDVFRQSLRDARRFERRLLAHRTPHLSLVKDTGDPKTSLAHLQLIDEAYRCTGLLQLYRVFPDLLNERYAPWDEQLILQPAPSETVPSAKERQTWLTKLAIHILNILREIPFESRTRSVQPFIMVSSASELKHDDVSDADGNLGVSQFSIEVARARKFISSRLAAYTHILSLRKIRVIFELIRSIWSALDAGEKDVYWLDVAYEKQLGTMMG
ncbi:unnamed protein product [Clonostachys solani]|uniref:Zn(2)-C6 fungal-type domain-containing protein n=1 Tax=Clonostachys solani TaxID=160281 RepID=A0A9N9W9Q2_9HYPO|nr:unnamed protein product [Clonostachys solani]